MELMVGELDIFQPSLIQTSVIGGDWQNYLPVQAITKDGPIQFSVPGQGSSYFDLNKTLLYVRFKVTDSLTGEKLDADAEFSLKNNVLNTLFADVKLEFNQTTVSHSNHMNHYRSYLELLYNFNATAKKTHLTSALYYQDTAGAFNDLTSVPNKKRKSFVVDGKEVEVLGKLHCDMLAAGKYLLNNVDLRVTLTRNPASMVLLTGKDSKIVPQIDIQEAALYVRKVKINPGILVAHAQTLESAVARYNYKRVEMLNFTISSGLQQKCVDNLFLNRIPSRLIFGLVKNSAFSGSYTESPFNFEHFDMNYIALSVNGQTVGAAPYKPNFESGRSIRPYLFSFYGVGIHMTDDGFEVDREDFDKGYALYCYDLTGDLSSCESHLSVENQGSCRIELGFAKPLPCVVNLIIYAEFPDCIESFQNLKRKLIPKEVVVITPKTVSKYYVKPSKPLSDLHRKERILIGWATRNYHNLDWYAGDVDISDLHYLLYCKTLSYEKIYTMGHEKALYFTEIIGKPVEDLTRLGCPNMRRNLGPACSLHSKTTAHCAETDAQFLAKWIAENLNE
ncbi:uncharacterized protein F54H12.2-like [Neocloeon triangulifer]|uniref:uncharacterized protein F54H12.2-like n=1 Tax=Neocloeon triangulifer TaxID=2078957 RepID=UPI00286F2ADC|nr:uncharacterized protein F54H12.2-like [Neocloeon triangulifer]XP_059479433.1 uncharacterized protein F54H12.2-like [Neocloeon triangulifer]